MSTSDDKEREKFEKWANSQKWSEEEPPETSRDDLGRYNYSDVEYGWQSWQACVAAGESRERELERRLQVCLADIDTLLLVAGSGVLPEVERMIKLNQSEAERLLGR